MPIFFIILTVLLGFLAGHIIVSAWWDAKRRKKSPFRDLEFILTTSLITLYFLSMFYLLIPEGS